MQDRSKSDFEGRDKAEALEARGVELEKKMNSESANNKKRDGVNKKKSEKAE